MVRVFARQTSYKFEPIILSPDYRKHIPDWRLEKGIIMTKKLYRTTQEFIYPPTGFYYAAGVEVDLDDWHPDDIKEALRSLIVELKSHPDTLRQAQDATPPISKVEGPTKQPAEGTHSKDTKELN